MGFRWEEVNVIYKYIYIYIYVCVCGGGGGVLSGVASTASAIKYKNIYNLQISILIALSFNYFITLFLVVASNYTIIFYIKKEQFISQKIIIIIIIIISLFMSKDSKLLSYHFFTDVNWRVIARNFDHTASQCYLTKVRKRNQHA